MFYSQCLLSKKGALGTIWIAAHCLKRLHKDQVFHTNISSSVDIILVDEVPVVTHRVLAFLLLGVVKIYSQKVEYLYDDCNRVVDKLNDFSGIKKKVVKVIEGMRAPRLSITRPKKMELDTFDLQILEEENGDDERAAEDTTQEDAFTIEKTRYHSPEQIHYETGVSLPESCSKTHTPVQDVLSPYTTDKDIGTSSPNAIISESSIENLRINIFSLDDHLEPMVLDETHDYSAEINMSGTKFTESEKRQFSTEDHQAPMSVDVTFQSKSPHDMVTTPELIRVQTPVIRERGSSSRKRKCLFDDVVVLSNKVVKDSLNDASDLVCKRRKAPHTALHAWKRYQISNLPRTFLEPSFPCASSELRSLFSEAKLQNTEAVKNVENAETLEKPNILESPTIFNKSPDEAYVTPSTPVAQSASIRTNNDDIEYTEFDRGDFFTSTIERIEEESSQSEEEDLESSLNNEDINSQGVNQERDGWTDRTRFVVTQLYRSFLSRNKRRQKNGVSLSQTLKKKTRSESAVFFYETLVLKTSGYIDLEQNELYGDILVLETPKLKQTYGTGKFDMD